MQEVVINPNPVLRKKAGLIEPDKIKSSAIKKLIAEMSEALACSKNGIGLAAPQIGVSKSVFIVLKDIARLSSGGQPQPDDTPKKEFNKKDILIFINPKIIKRSRKTEILNEGCLSVPDIYGNIRRHKQVTLEALDEHGNKVIRGAGGLLAQVFQHECDHLDGKLFIDVAAELYKYEK